MNNYYYSSELSTFEYRYDVILSKSSAEKFTNARNERRVLKAHTRNCAGMKQHIARLIWLNTRYGEMKRDIADLREYKQNV